MTQPLLRPPPSLQPPPKAVSTFSSPSQTSSNTSTSPQISRPPSRSHQSTPAQSRATADYSNRATVAFVRRVLCPHSHGGAADSRPIDELLPPLTSSNEVDLQLYAIIAIIVKELVYSWYGKITPDQGFVEEVVKIIAHCTRALEGRLRTVDLEGLVFDEIPELVESHVVAHRISHQPMQPSLVTDPRLIYHNIHPHPALSPVPDPSQPATAEEQLRHEAEYRQLLVQGALAVLLPTEDLENACLRTLVADVIGETILGDAVGGKVCEGWFIWTSITKVIEAVKARMEPEDTTADIAIGSGSRLEQFGLLSSERAENTSLGDSSAKGSAVSAILWKILQCGYLTFVAIRFVILGLVAASSKPPPNPSPSTSSSGVKAAPIVTPMEPPRPVLAFKAFNLVSTLLDLPLRMPWLSGSLSLVRHHLLTGAFRQVGATHGLLDQFIHHLLTTYVLPATLIAPLLQQTRQSLFPNNALPPPSPPPPTPAEILSIKHTTASAIASLVPPLVAKRVFGSVDEMVAEVKTELEVWEDGYLNRHLAYQVLELVLVRVLPEMGEKGVRGLMDGRVGSFGGV